ncbi:MAG TPA: hypothetical protein VFA98_10510 [Thermoanaerobaculia bacterium]|jgi:hypothetical protein|nr:hypothetical protein [Thermoanaerobaculia bacterium]
MFLNVTITGADDDVDPNQLAHLSRFYPFVEWGILFSEKRRALPRYPSLRWIRSLEDVAARRGQMKLAMHLCGSEARIATLGAKEFSPGAMWRRVQVNGYETGTATREWIQNGFTWILQARTRETLRAAIDDACVSSADVLYDPSGGEGSVQQEWPTMPTASVSEERSIGYGYAGGINPINVAAVIGQVRGKSLALDRIWIDMESGVRTEDRFDIEKVKAVLAAVADARREVWIHRSVVVGAERKENR